MLLTNMLKIWQDKSTDGHSARVAHWAMHRMKDKWFESPNQCSEVVENILESFANGKCTCSCSYATIPSRGDIWKCKLGNNIEIQHTIHVLLVKIPSKSCSSQLLRASPTPTRPLQWSVAPTWSICQTPLGCLSCKSDLPFCSSQVVLGIITSVLVCYWSI